MTSDDFRTAEPREYTRRALEEDYYPQPIQDELNYLWENPDEFEQGMGDPISGAKRTGMSVEVYTALHLGVCFGIEYEKAYPTGRRDDWPVPIEERPTLDGDSSE